MKYVGEIGYYNEGVLKDGVYTKEVLKVKIKGDMDELRIDKVSPSENNQQYENTSFNNFISFIPNGLIRQKIKSGDLAYITLDGFKWKISSISYNRPRVKLTIGGLYNGE